MSDLERIGDIIGEIVEPSKDAFRPIKTTYRGVVYRSRLEARWAVFLRHLGIEAIYEFEGFELPCGRYLPDFWLPGLRTWLEIKPDETCDENVRRKCEQLAAMTQKPVALAWGMPHPYERMERWWPEDEYDHVGWDNYQGFCECLVCGNIGIAFEGRWHRLCGQRCVPDSDRGHTGKFGPRLQLALEDATRERFWDPTP